MARKVRRIKPPPSGHARSAITGRYVTLKQAKASPRTTVIEKK